MLVESLILAKLDYACHNLSSLPPRKCYFLRMSPRRRQKRHRYDDIIMGFYGKAFNNGLQAKAAGSKPILFPANQNLGRSGLYHS